MYRTRIDKELARLREDGAKKQGKEGEGYNFEIEPIDISDGANNATLDHSGCEGGIVMRFRLHFSFPAESTTSASTSASSPSASFYAGLPLCLQISIG